VSFSNAANRLSATVNVVFVSFKKLDISFDPVQMPSFAMSLKKADVLRVVASTLVEISWISD